jgi:glycosyltransferase involved in cell wall biosynthesis
MPQNKTIAFPHPPGAGGPGSFQKRFENELKKNNWSICYAGEAIIPDVIFIVGGTKKLFWLWKLKRQGIPIIFRLDGINWLHKKKKIIVKDYFLAELINIVLKFIHAFIADKIIYQSQFVKDCWQKEGWRNKVNTDIINNGVTVLEQSDINKVSINRTIKRVVVLEGVVDYTPYAVELLNKLAQQLLRKIQIEIYGKFENSQNKNALDSRLQYKGFVKPKEVSNILLGAVYFYFGY